MKTPKYVQIKCDRNGRGILNTKTNQTFYQNESAEYDALLKKCRAAQARRERNELMESFGLTKVKGAVSGRTYWE